MASFRSRPFDRRIPAHCLSRILLGIMLALSIGCSNSPSPQIETFPVTGQVLINGKPPHRAEIRFKPKVPLMDPLDRSVEPHAIVEEDGSYQVTTYSDGDGAPPGDYAVTIIWREITFDGGEEVFGPDKLNRKFSDPQYPVTTVTVTEDDNQVPAIKIEY